MKYITCLTFYIFLVTTIVAQKSGPTIEIVSTGTNTSLRGLSVVTDEILWTSGSNGTVGKSTNGGKDWRWLQVKGFEKTDFRDIEAFDAFTAVIMGVGEPAYILRTVDGGDSWKVVYENKAKGMFLDAMEFWNEQAGIVIGDPIDGKFFIARTFDGGKSWQEVPMKYRPVADSGEACFAASGTNIRVLDRDEAVFVSGGMTSNVYIRNQKIRLPIIQGTESTGAYSIAVNDRFKLKGGNHLLVVGGDYKKDTVITANSFFSTNRGKSWKPSKVPPSGYRSCVEFISKTSAITCGTSGVDYTGDGGNTWVLLSKEGFHVTRQAKEGTSVYLAGPNGKVAKMIFTKK